MARILIVDDDPDLAWILDALLREIGYATATAADGAEGFLQVDAFKPDVVLCDVEMPVLSGPGLMQRLLIEDCGRENIPVVLVSGVVDLPVLAAQCGTPYFLEKPVTIEELRDVVNRALVEQLPPRPAEGKGADR